MASPMPTVQSYMTTAPHSIGVDQPVSRAHEVMREHRIRHLPVLHGGRLVGILTEGDMRLIASLAEGDQERIPVEDAMSPFVYAVAPDTPLHAVVAMMADHKYGSAVVMDKQRVVGIFTTVDVCRAFAELLQTRRVA
jgi:acetoin utilization protein AcuB